ncbi:MAG: hypothetical protein RLZZ246_1083 [Planctomycetota bacterium]
METTAKKTPSKNPDVGKPAVIAPPARGPEPKTKIAGASLVPDLDKRSKDGQSVLRQYRYWVGVTPSCPVEYLTLAGICFPKVNENLIEDPLRTNQKRRVPVIGAIVFLTEDKIRKMREVLPRTVIRFIDDGEKEEPGTGQNIGDNFVRPRRGQRITIPTMEEIEQRKKAGKPTRQYVPHAGDEPAARYMFAVLCSDQERGSRGEYYPDTLETAGLEWPGELEADELLK